MQSSAPFRKSIMARVEPSSHAAVWENSGSWPVSRSDGSSPCARISDHAWRGVESGSRASQRTIADLQPSSPAAICAVSIARRNGLERISAGSTPALRARRKTFSSFRLPSSVSARSASRPLAARSSAIPCRSRYSSIRSAPGARPASAALFDSELRLDRHRRNVGFLHQLVERLDFIGKQAPRRAKLRVDLRGQLFVDLFGLARRAGVVLLHRAELFAQILCHLDHFLRARIVMPQRNVLAKLLLRLANIDHRLIRLR